MHLYAYCWYVFTLGNIMQAMDGPAWSSLTCSLRLAFCVRLVCSVRSGDLLLSKPGLRTGRREVREGAPRRKVHRGGKAGGASARKLGDCESAPHVELQYIANQSLPSIDPLSFLAAVCLGLR